VEAEKGFSSQREGEVPLFCLEGKEGGPWKKHSRVAERKTPRKGGKAHHRSKGGLKTHQTSRSQKKKGFCIQNIRVSTGFGGGKTMVRTGGMRGVGRNVNFR